VNAAELLADADAVESAARARVVPEEPERSHAEEILARYDEVDAKLTAAGWPPTSDWWRAVIVRWYLAGVRWLIDRVGRRGGKSSTLSRLAVVEALYGHHAVPPGDIGTVAIVSTDRPEAMGRLRTIEAIVDALGVAWKPCKAPIVGIELVHKRVCFRVFTASIAGVSGFTGIFLLLDEVAKWADADTGANPATEVIRSIRPTMQTQPNARAVMSSSPMGMLDAHYDAFEEGETPLQVTAEAPTWVANPTITEQQTRTDEPDESTWLREYAAVPQAEAETSLLTDMLIVRAQREDRIVTEVERLQGLTSADLARAPGHWYVATIDPATRGNAWTLIVATRGPDRVRRIVLAREWRGTPSIPLVSKDVFREIKELLKPFGLTWVTSDQWAGDPLREIASQVGITLILEPWTNVNKREAYEGLRTMLLDEELELPPVDAVRTDLLGIRKKLTRNGVTYELAKQGPRHSDFAPTVAMAAMKVRGVAKLEAPPKSDAEKADENKRKFLEGLTRDKRRQERMGLPVRQPTPMGRRR